MDIWFSLNVGEIETREDGSHKMKAESSRFCRLTKTTDQITASDVAELHRLLDAAIGTMTGNDNGPN